MKEYKLWCEQIERQIKQKGKKIVLVAGASSSGKSYSSKVLCDYLCKNGIRAKVYSADNYYKGVSRIITEKALQKNNAYKNLLDESEQIASVVRSITGELPSQEKFTLQNQQKLCDDLCKKYGQIGVALAKEIAFEYEHINFDEPSAISFKNLAKDLEVVLKCSGKIISPAYSFITGESKLYEKNSIDVADYDVFIVEGLYVLRDELEKLLDANKVVKTYIDCDSKTLLSRKLNSDIVHKRSAFTEEQVIMSFLLQVMPSYYSYIYPTKSKAEIVLNSTLTKGELDDKNISKQIKFFAPQNIQQSLENLGCKKLQASKQIDYFFENKNQNCETFSIFLREENGLATKLAFKSNVQESNILKRNIEEYDLENQMSLQNRNSKKLLSDFLTSGLELGAVVEKTRSVYKYKDITFKLDEVENLGVFVEFDDIKNPNTVELAKKLGLKKVCQNSYFFEQQKIQVPVCQNTEIEIKCLVDKIPNLPFRQKQIEQVYINTNAKKHIISVFLPGVDFDKISQVRVRKIVENGKPQYFLTAKSSGEYERAEYEIKIPKTIYDLLADGENKKIQKTRYVISKNGYNFEFDKFHGAQDGLVMVEVEIKQNNPQTIKQIKQILTNEFGLCIQDVSKIEQYKNSNLAENGKNIFN